MARHCNPDYGKTLQTRKWQDIAILKMAKHGEGRAGREKEWGYGYKKDAR